MGFFSFMVTWFHAIMCCSLSRSHYQKQHCQRWEQKLLELPTPKASTWVVWFVLCQGLTWWKPLVWPKEPICLWRVSLLTLLSSTIFPFIACTGTHSWHRAQSEIISSHPLIHFNPKLTLLILLLTMEFLVLNNFEQFNVFIVCYLRWKPTYLGMNP